MTSRTRVVIKIIIAALFFISLFMVELGPYSSNAVTGYNGGYGTFDMKSYNAETVKTVLSKMSSEGIKAEYRYYVCDFIFIIMLFIVQFLLGSSFLSKKIFFAATIVAFLRGAADIIENILLIIIIHSYPSVNDFIVNVSSCITQIKLICVMVWNIIFFAGLVYKVFKRL